MLSCLSGAKLPLATFVARGFVGGSEETIGSLFQVFEFTLNLSPFPPSVDRLRPERARAGPERVKKAVHFWLVL
jgi:hypothetical protein